MSWQRLAALLDAIVTIMMAFDFLTLLIFLL
jgi:hypothetical protein